MKEYIERCMGGWIPLFFGFVIVACASLVEPLYFPVVRDWSAKSMRYEDGKVVISGHMRKTRDCFFVGVTAIGFTDHGRKVGLPILFQDNTTDNAYTRPVGAQGWGPWTITIPAQLRVREIEFRAAHQCHFFWATITKLGTATIYE